LTTVFLVNILANNYSWSGEFLGISREGMSPLFSNEQAAKDYMDFTPLPSHHFFKVEEFHLEPDPKPKEILNLLDTYPPEKIDPPSENNDGPNKPG